VSSPSRNQHLGFLQRGEDLAIEQFIPELCSVTPIDQNINLAQLGDNLLRRVPLPRHGPSSKGQQAIPQVPLAVIDATAQAEADADYRVMPSDILAWERTNGPLPDGACVAMNSGWDRHVSTKMFRNVDDRGVMHFPGLHPKTAEFLIRERRVQGVAVDTLSLDHGPLLIARSSSKC
jgi:hypothetical protein